MTQAIELDLLPNGQGSIRLGGVNIADYVAAGSVSILHPQGELPKVYVTLQRPEAKVRVDGGLVVEMPEDFRDMLIAAGWTAP